MRVAVNSHALPIYKKNRIASSLCIFETIHVAQNHCCFTLVAINSDKRVAPVVGSVVVLCFIVRYFVFIFLVLQSSCLGGKSFG